ncbi:leucine-rich repeat domain-containing protein, partial [Vicingaceae bacterium]|nr:leucine-rich repeat domain-containing protein [Vicingaceae bacterium]
EYDKAEKVIAKAIVFDKNTTSPATERREGLLATIKDLKIGYELNESATIDLNKVQVKAVNKPLSDFPQFEADFKIHGDAEKAADLNKDKEEFESGVADGSINPYQQYVIPVVTGSSLTLPDLKAKMMGQPAGNKLNEFPKEVLDLDIAVLVLRGNNINSIPANITKLKELKKLDLSNNQLTSLPVGVFAELKDLKKLILKGNSIPQEQVDKIQLLLPNCNIKM